MILSVPPLIADFAIYFGNINVAAESQPISELNIQPLICAITTMRAFKDNIILHHSLWMPIITMASSIEACTLNPQNKTKSCNNARPDVTHQFNIPGPKPVHTNGNKVPHTFVGEKHNTMTPENGSKPSPVQRKKKQRRVITNDTVKHA